MENTMQILRKLPLVCALLPCISIQSCNFLLGIGEDETGRLEVRFLEAKSDIGDLNSYLITVCGPDGNMLFEGNYGSMPESLIAEAGTYTVSARSCEFSSPAFDSPLFGDDKTAVVGAGSTATVTLECAQLNSGLRLRFEESFTSEYYGLALTLKASGGQLCYETNEKRTAFFNPGPVTLVMGGGDSAKTLFTRNLESRQVLTLTLSAKTGGSGATGQAASGSIAIQLDTTREWLSENLVIGGEGSEQDNALGVPAAREAYGSTDVWVCGYIVGGDLSSSRCSFEPPFVSRTNIVLASRSSCKDKEACLSVQLSKGDVRDAVNLVDNPGNLGRWIYLKGDIVESYYGIPGLQNISGYVIQ